MPNPVVHFEIMGGSAPNQLQDFYRNIFGWHVDANNPMNYGLVDTHTENGIGGGVGPSEDGKPRVTVYVGVDDLDAYLKKVEALGGKTVLPPTEIPDMVTLAMFADPSGNVIGLIKG